MRNRGRDLILSSLKRVPIILPQATRFTRVKWETSLPVFSGYFLRCQTPGRERCYLIPVYVWIVKQQSCSGEGKQQERAAVLLWHHLCVYGGNVVGGNAQHTTHKKSSKHKPTHSFRTSATISGTHFSSLDPQWQCDVCSPVFTLQARAKTSPSEREGQTCSLLPTHHPLSPTNFPFLG